MASVQRNIQIDSETWRHLKKESVERKINVRELAGEILMNHTEKKKRKDRSKNFLM